MKLYLKPIAMAFAVALVAGCGTQSHRIDPKGSEGLTTTNEINFKDYQNTSVKIVNSILRSGVLVRNDGKKTVVMISTIKNSTSEHLQPNILTNQIRLSMLRSGKAIITTAVSGSGAEDKAVRQVRDLQDDEMFNQKTVKKNGRVIAPDMSLNGEIIQKKSRNGRARESYFQVHLTLTDLDTGLAVWEDYVEFTKQEVKPLFGL
jgi:uncharacterized protein (TIGR02722 family)